MKSYTQVHKRLEKILRKAEEKGGFLPHNLILDFGLRADEFAASNLHTMQTGLTIPIMRARKELLENLHPKLVEAAFLDALYDGLHRLQRIPDWKSLNYILVGISGAASGILRLANCINADELEGIVTTGTALIFLSPMVEDFLSARTLYKADIATATTQGSAYPIKRMLTIAYPDAATYAEKIRNDEAVVPTPNSFFFKPSVENRLEALRKWQLAVDGRDILRS